LEKAVKLRVKLEWKEGLLLRRGFLGLLGAQDWGVKCGAQLGLKLILGLDCQKKSPNWIFWPKIIPSQPGKKGGEGLGFYYRKAPPKRLLGKPGLF